MSEVRNNGTQILIDIIKDFSPDKFVRFFREKNRPFAPRKEDLIQYNDDNFRNGIKLGEIQFAQDEKMLICAFEASQPLSERSGKKAQYEKGKKILKDSQSDAGIFIFYDEQGSFRFSLIYANYLGKKRDWSVFRRFTYFVSKEYTNKTFLQQIGEEDFSSLDKIKDAFSVEKVTKAFYTDIANWYFWTMDKAQFPKDFKYSAEPQKDDELRNAINLIRLITRIIFIWFIRQKGIIPDALFDKNLQKNIVKDFCRDNKSANYYNVILQNLFFGTLNQKIDERGFVKEGSFHKNINEYGVKNLFRYADKFTINEKEVIGLFKDIPFLNGGLFDCLDKPNDDGTIIYVDGFSRNPSKQAKIPDYLFFQGNETSVDLSSLGLGRNQKVKGLFEILNNYNFTIDENTPIDQEVALDPELLGKVFENLLASYNPETATTARKTTGSYYTPREIVDYMVDESLVAYLMTALERHSHTLSCNSRESGNPESLQTNPNSEELDARLRTSGMTENRKQNNESRLRHLLSYTDEPHKFSPIEAKEIIAAINNIKILDPACGSGAFPMGMLHKLVHILHKLDADNKVWYEIQYQKAIAETEDAFRIGSKEEREQRLKEINNVFDQNTNEPDYARKLYLIENCIYGVDIQPIAVQISKLRFFISLVIDQKVDKSKPNYGILSLPNLETKFTAANTLIGLEKPEQLAFRSPAVLDLEKKITLIRHKYFEAKTWGQKSKCQRDDKKLRRQLAEALKHEGWLPSTAEKIVQFDPYDQNTSADWFDPEWMFGIKSPSPLAGEGKSLPPKYLSGGEGGFDVVIGNPPYGADMDDQTLQKIVETYSYYDRQKNSASFFIEVASKLVKENAIATYIVPKSLSFSEGWQKTRQLITDVNTLHIVADVSKSFENVLLEAIIISFFKKRNIQTYSFMAAEGWNTEIILTGSPTNDLIKELDILPVYVTPARLNILRKMSLSSVSLSTISYTFRGLPLQSKVLKDGDFILRGKNVGRYKIYGEIDKISLPAEYLQKKKVKDIMQKKIVSQNIVAHVLNPYDRIIIMASLDKEGLLTLDTVMNTIMTSQEYAYEYILALLNSRLASWFYYWFVYNRAVRTMHFDKYYIDKLPIKNITIADQQPFITLVDQILAAKKKDPNADTTALERKIDEMVYELYGLTPEEIEIVEGRGN